MEEDHFDYVIIEEASQAFLSTIAMARKLGKKCIVIGDICQLEPIIQKEYSIEDPNNFHFMVCGLKALSFFYKNSKNYILTDSYRLTPNSVSATNSFYDEKLVSKSDAILPLAFSEGSFAGRILNSNGGPSIKRITMDNGISPCRECFEIIEKLIKDLMLINPKVEIAILAFNRETVRALQSRIFSQFNKVENLLIETVDRIQGMTVDYCIYVIPQESIPFSIQPNRFNVATSRARLCTLIISDTAIDAFTPYHPNVDTYIKRIK
jgi:superfamily I DNA and/or RNA helicase